MTTPRPPVIWSIAGTDSGGGAGLAADQRAADAFSVHLCPVVAAVTAQNSQAVTHIAPLPVETLEAQLEALAEDLPPRVVKTGLLGGAPQVAAVARWIDRLRAAHGEVALVVDPVLGASSGAAFADAQTLAAYRELLLPRATLVTPNQAEGRRLVGDDSTARDIPGLAAALRERGAQGVCITGGDSPSGADALDWCDTPLARGWLALPRQDTTHTHGTGCTFASSAAAALALGFVSADALVLAKMATAHALQRARRAGSGPGPVVADAGFSRRADLLPTLSFGTTPTPWIAPVDAASPTPPLGLYALSSHVAGLRALLDAGVRTLQLRIKVPDEHPGLAETLIAAVQACQAAGAQLFVNDHLGPLLRLIDSGRLRIAPGPGETGTAAPRLGVHLGQEDLMALGEVGRAALAASGLAVGVSSHSLWELARSRGVAPAYIACGPVWPTLTKAMPWRPQGLDNLGWWVAMAGRPVVAIGGILAPDQAQEAAACGASGVCVVRAVAEDPAGTVPAFAHAWAHGHAAAPRRPAAALPHPSLAA